jgi:hypothetical protein
VREQPTDAEPGWRTEETTESSGAVASRQWIQLRSAVVSSDAVGARELGRRYLDEVRRVTRGLVRTGKTARGPSLLLAGAVPLLRFAPPEVEVTGDRVECRYGIVGGILAAQAGGTLSIAQCSSVPPELELAVVGYFPRLHASRRRRSLRRWLYGVVQARAHRAISRRFLERAATETQP